MELFTAIVASSAVFLFVVWYVRSKYQAESRVRSLSEQHRVLLSYQEPFNQRVAFPAVEGVANAFMTILPTSMIGRAKRWLTIAGDTFSLSQFFTVVLLTTTAIPAVYFMLIWAATEGDVPVAALLPIPVFITLGFVVPLLLLRRMALNRQKTIWRAMPNALDLMTTCVEAGLSLDFALQRVAERYKGPLSDEILRALREIGLGMTRREALLGMTERVALPDLSTFINSIVQAETLGTSVGHVLRAQSADMRRRRRQRAEQIARQAPVKMVFPTVFFLMPCLFIITLAPMLIHLFRELGD